MKIRVAEGRDAEGMSKVLAAIVRITKRERASDPAFVLAHYIQNPSGVCCSIALDPMGRVLGFQSLIRSIPGDSSGLEEDWGIIGTHIDPYAQRQGVGRALFKASREAAAQARLKGIVASIGRSNETALRYYEAMGFRMWREDAATIHKVFAVSEVRLQWLSRR